MTAAGVDCRDTRQVGRNARLELVFTVRGGRTVLAHAYAEPPFRAGRCFPDGDGLHMILASSAPGIFGGDALTQTIVVEEGARVRLSSQSAAQLHPVSDAAVAHLRSTYEVASGARLHCRWDPLIPFAGAVLDQQIAITLAPDAELCWSDALMNGRSGRGERWLFTSLRHELRVSRGGVLEYLERYRLTPAEDPVDGAWSTADAQFFGTTIVTGRFVEAGEPDRLSGAVDSVGGVRAAADRLADALLVVRLMSPSGARFHEARSLLQRLVGDVRRGGANTSAPGSQKR